MKLNSIISQPPWKLILKISAVGFSFVLVTYCLVWMLLAVIQFFVEGIFF